jgi:hypothetical protein
MVWYNPLTWENPLKASWGAPAETEEPEPAVDTADLAPAPAGETEGGEMPTTTGGRRKKHRKTKRSKKSKSKKTGRRKH